MLTKEMGAFIAKNNLIPAGARVGAAVSGGADSMAMLYALCALGVDVCVLHFEHGIRGAASEEDLRFVEGYCAARGIPFYVARADVPGMCKAGESVETAARRLRYAFFAETAERYAIDLIATAHHADDNAETFLLHLLRGSGMTGLCGIRAKRPPNIIRPLLFAQRSEIEAYCAVHEIPYVTDETNLSDDYARNYVRHELLPRMGRLNPRFCEAINRAQELLTEEEATLAVYTEREFSALATVETGRVSLRRDALAALPIGMQRRVLRRAATELGSAEDLEKQHVESLLHLVARGTHGKKFDLPKKFSAFVSYNSLILATKAYKIDRIEVYPLVCAGTTPLWEESRLTAARAECVCFGNAADLVQYFDGDALAGAVVRTRRTGDWFCPLGMRGKKKLKEWLIDRKIPAEQRDALVLVARGSEILWIVGHAVSETARVRADSQNIIKLEYTKSEEE